nr:hypothetical protein [Tanacetum cinerariifolium]
MNPDFDKIDSPFQQTSSLKPYVPNVILEKIIIDLEDKVVNILEKEKANLETIESLKSKGFESSESAVSESENQSENDCLVVEKECDKEENPKLGIESYQTQLNLTKPRWDATGFEYQQDYMVIDSPRAVTFVDRYGVQMIRRFNEIHKFSNDTLHQIDEALDYRVKEFKRWRLQTSEVHQMITSSRQSRSISGGNLLQPRSLKPKRTIESRAKRSSKIFSVGYYSIMLASSHTVKSKTNIKSPTHYPCGIARTSE